MWKENEKCANNQGPLWKIRNHHAIIWISRTLWFTVILILLSLCGTAFARDLPQYVAPGEHITLLAPPGYTYQWTKYDASGQGTLAGTDQTCIIDVPTDAETSDILSAVLTMTESHGCIGYKAIYLQVQAFTCPILDDFCQHAAQPADAAKFIYDNFPTAKGFTYAWSGDGLDVTKINGKSASEIQTYLNGVYDSGSGDWVGGLDAGQYTATFTVKHGTRTAWTCSDDFAVFSLPSGAITLTQ
jgi:hypothetical protein